MPCLSLLQVLNCCPEVLHLLTVRSVERGDAPAVSFFQSRNFLMDLRILLCELALEFGVGGLVCTHFRFCRCHLHCQQLIVTVKSGGEKRSGKKEAGDGKEGYRGEYDAAFGNPEGARTVLVTGDNYVKMFSHCTIFAEVVYRPMYIRQLSCLPPDTLVASGWERGTAGSGEGVDPYPPVYSEIR